MLTITKMILATNFTGLTVDGFLLNFVCIFFMSLRRRDFILVIRFIINEAVRINEVMLTQKVVDEIFKGCGVKTRRPSDQVI